MARSGFGVEDQRAETGFAIVVTTSSLQKEEMRVVKTKKGTLGGRAISFDVEIAAIRETIR